MPSASWITCTAGAIELVVQEAQDLSGFLSAVISVTPSTQVEIPPDDPSFLGGADRITCLAPACRCKRMVSSVRNIPVDSITVSTPNLPHGNLLGSFSANTL